MAKYQLCGMMPIYGMISQILYSNSNCYMLNLFVWQDLLSTISTLRSVTSGIWRNGQGDYMSILFWTLKIIGCDIPKMIVLTTNKSMREKS